MTDKHPLWTKSPEEVERLVDNGEHTPQDMLDACQHISELEAEVSKLYCETLKPEERHDELLHDLRQAEAERDQFDLWNREANAKLKSVEAERDRLRKALSYASSLLSEDEMKEAALSYAVYQAYLEAMEEFK